MILHPFYIVHSNNGGISFLKGKWKIYVKIMIEIMKKCS